MNDDRYPMENFKGAPEFAAFDRDNYNVNVDEELPSIIYTSTMGVNELSPIPMDLGYNYQEEIFNLDRWSIFRSLPQIMNFDQSFNNLLKGMRNGTIKVPDYMNTNVPPTLWAYYSTLPTWLRDHPVVRNVFMAFEHHHPNVKLRDKELALNYACSFIRPIDKALENVIVEIASSTKIRMNIERVRHI